METKQTLIFNTKARLADIREINTSFAVGTLYVMYTGDNRNQSDITKDAVIDALPSLYNVPIVCHWNAQTEEIGGHDIELITGNDGKKRIRNLTDPIGVIPDHAIFHFSTEEDEYGNSHEYLVIENVILWRRQDACRHIIENLGGVIDHSMEITVFEGEEREDGIYRIDRFEFTALCLLGNCEPCFEGSRLTIYSADEMENFKHRMAEMLEDLKDNYHLITASHEVDDIHPLNFETEGGNGILEEKLNLAGEYGIDVEALDFSLDDYSLDELKEKFEAMKNDAQDETQSNFALLGNLTEEICNVLDEDKITTEWGERNRYWYVDCDPDKNEVYCWDTTDWLLYGFAYTMNGDCVVINYDSKKRVKYVIEDFDCGEQNSPFVDVFTAMEQKITSCTAEYEAINGKYLEAAETVSALNEEVHTLRDFKRQVEIDKLVNAQNEVLDRFSAKLSGVEAFEALRADHGDMDVDALEEKCYAILGRHAGAKFAIEPKTPRIPVESTENTNKSEPYGGAFVKYGVVNSEK